MEATVGVVLLTYKRTEYALRTIEAFDKHARGSYAWYMADDGSERPHVEAVLAALKRKKQVGSHTYKGGYGYSCNRAYETLRSKVEFTFWLEDDWVLERELNLDYYAEVLRENPQFGMIRFGYLNPNMVGKSIGLKGQMYWHLNRAADSYVFTGHPSLRSKNFMDTYGPYPVNLNPGMTELGFAEQFRHREGPGILWPNNNGDWGPFGHIGAEKSYTA